MLKVELACAFIAVHVSISILIQTKLENKVISMDIAMYVTM